jgi:hypothetical protein
LVTASQNRGQSKDVIMVASKRGPESAASPLRLLDAVIEVLELAMRRSLMLTQDA